MGRCRPHSRRAQPTRTTARMVSRMGWLVGVLERRSGAAGCMERVARRREVAAKQLPHRTIATQGSPTGWLDGLWPRRPGVARTEGRAAHQLREVAPECDAICDTAISAGA